MFFIKCSNCNWSVKTLGNKKSLQELDLREIANNCSKCGKARKFICKKCGQIAKMLRIK